MAPFIGVAVELGREAAVRFGRDNRFDFGLRQRLAQPVRVESPIREELSAGQSVDERGRAPQVVGLSGQQPKVDQVASAASVNAMILVVTPPRERPIA